MPINPYFDFLSQDIEKDLLSDLNAECIEINGFQMFYLPRTHAHLNSIFGEDTESTFNKAYSIEAQIDSPYATQNTNDIITLVGEIIRDSATFLVARSTFSERLSGSGLVRPREGDLLYFPIPHRSADLPHLPLFKIVFVEDEGVFYQVGGLYVWQVKVELFKYSHEKLRTGIPEIDAIENRYVASVDMVMGAGSGSFEAKERVYQGDDIGSATFVAEVISWSSPNLKIKHAKGAPDLSEPLIGEDSGASRAITSTSSSTDASTNDPMTDNEEFQDLGTDIVDFDDSNPFGGE